MFNVINGFIKDSNPFPIDGFEQCTTRQDIFELFVKILMQHFSIDGLICFPGAVFFLNQFKVLPPIMKGTFDTFLFSFEDENQLRDCVTHLDKMKLLPKAEFQGYMHSFLINNDCKNINYVLRLASRRYDHGILLIDGLVRLSKRDQKLFAALSRFVVEGLDHVFDYDCFYHAEQSLINGVMLLKQDITTIESRSSDNNEWSVVAPEERLSLLAHDVRSPLFILRNLSAQLRNSTEEENHQDAFKLMENSVEKISHQLSFECQPKTKRIEPKVRLSILIQDSIQLCTPALSVKSVSFDYNIDVGDTMVSHRRAYVIFRLLNNFLGNACKYTPHGTVSLRATIEQSGDVPYLDLNIIDTGIGIPASVLISIKQFESDIYQENYLQFGNGLGLPICQRLLSSIHGSMNILESSSNGTHLQCHVPLSGAVGHLHSAELQVPHD